MPRIDRLISCKWHAFVPQNVVADCQKASFAIIKDQTIRPGHFGSHRVAAEDHPWIKNGKFADRPVQLATLDGQLFPALRARQLEPGADLLPKVVRGNHAAPDRRSPADKGFGGPRMKLKKNVPRRFGRQVSQP